MKSKLPVMIILFFCTVLPGCELFPPDVPGDTRSPAPDLKREIFLLNSLGESVSIINPLYAGELLPAGELDSAEYDDNGLDFDTGISPVYNGDDGNGLIATGRWPNQIVSINGSICIVESGSNRISVRDESTLREKGCIDLPAGCNPYYICADPDIPGRAYVTGFLDNNLYAVDLTGLTVIKNIPIDDGSLTFSCRGPEGIACADGRIFVACSNWNQKLFGYDRGVAAVIDSSTLTLEALISVESAGTEILFETIPDFRWGCNPQTILAFPDRHEIHIICSGTLGTDSPGNPEWEPYMSSDDGEIIIMDTETLVIKERLFVGGSPTAGEQGIDSVSGAVYLSGTGGIRVYGYLPGLHIIFGSGGASPLLAESSAYYPSLLLDTVNDKLFVCSFGADKIRILNIPAAVSGSYTEMEFLSVPDGPLSIYLSEEP